MHEEDPVRLKMVNKGVILLYPRGTKITLYTISWGDTLAQRNNSCQQEYCKITPYSTSCPLPIHSILLSQVHNNTIKSLAGTVPVNGHYKIKESNKNYKAVFLHKNL
jgi:hypothetical protein